MSRWRAALALIAGAGYLAASALAAEPAAGAKDERIRVQFVARYQTVLSSELAAKITQLPFREGDTFRAGQMLVTFDCDLYRAQLNKAQASAQAARETLAVSQRLEQLDSIGALELAQARARVKEAEAEAAAMHVTVDKCSLAAPFAGRIAKLRVEPYQFVSPGKPLLDILDTRHLEVQMIVPSKWLVWLKIGSRLDVNVDELGRDYRARVIRLGARIDPVSQSISLAARVNGEHTELLPGMSGWATFEHRR